MTKDQLELQAILAYAAYGSYRDAAKAIYSSPMAVHRRVRKWLMSHDLDTFKVPLPPTGQAVHSVPNTPANVTASHHLS